NLLKITVFMMVGVLVIMTGQMANGQEFRKELMKGIFQTIGPNVFKDMAKSMVAELAKDENFRKQVIQQVIHEVAISIGPENMKDIVKSVAGELANVHGAKLQLAGGVTTTADAGSMRAALVSVAGELTKNPAIMNALTSGGPVTSPQALMNILRDKTASSGVIRMLPNSEKASSSRSLRHDLIAVITHPSNPVDTLTVD